jgi:magnesium-transporting ATPase (P-type)
VLLGARAALLLALRGNGAPVPFVTSRGEPVLLDGHGVDAYDTVMAAAGSLGVAVVTLVVAGLALVTVRSAVRAPGRASLLLVGLLGYLVYVAVTTAFGSAYGPLFLLDVAALAAALPAFALAVSAVPRDVLETAVQDAGFPRRALTAFLFTAAAVTAVVWGLPLVGGLVDGTVPSGLDASTTMVTDALDLAVIVPAVVTAGVLVVRSAPAGPLIAVPLLALITGLLPTIVLSTVFQLAAGVRFTPAEIAGPIGGFVALGVVGAGLLVRILAATRRERLG